jgi:hypothetical protein
VNRVEHCVFSFVAEGSRFRSAPGAGAMGGPALLDVDPTHAINFDLVIGKTLESSFFIRNQRSNPIVYQVPLKCVRAFSTA